MGIVDAPIRPRPPHRPLRCLVGGIKLAGVKKTTEMQRAAASEHSTINRGRIEERDKSNNQPGQQQTGQQIGQQSRGTLEENKKLVASKGRTS